MRKWPLDTDEIAVWSAPETFYDGNQEFDFSYGAEAAASMMQAVLACNGPNLIAESGSCLLIPIYVMKYKLGLLIHLWRNLDLTDDAADLIRKAFNEYPELRDEPDVGFVSSDEMQRQYPKQIPAVRQLIRKLAPTAQFRDIHVTDHSGEMRAGVELFTDAGELLVHDDFGQDSLIDYGQEKIA